MVSRVIQVNHQRATQEVGPSLANSISAALSDGLALDASELLSLLFDLPEDDLLCAVKHCQIVFIEINMSILD